MGFSTPAKAQRSIPPISQSDAVTNSATVARVHLREWTVAHRRELNTGGEPGGITHCPTRSAAGCPLFSGSLPQHFRCPTTAVASGHSTQRPVVYNGVETKTWMLTRSRCDRALHASQPTRTKARSHATSEGRRGATPGAFSCGGPRSRRGQFRGLTPPALPSSSSERSHPRGGGGRDRPHPRFRLCDVGGPTASRVRFAAARP